METTQKKTLAGIVVSDKMDKTVVVRVTRSYRHPVVGKVMRTSKCYKVHDENEQASIGDHVEIFEGRPKSKTKYMYLASVCAPACNACECSTEVE